MTKKDWPTPESWHDLLKVVWNLDLIVDDSPKPPKPREWSGGGLLGIPFSPEPIDKAQDPEEPGQSRLAAGPDLPFDPNLRSDLERILPGISALGGSRPERLQNLRRRLLEQPAYGWLTRQPGFKSALETTRYWDARGDASYQGDSVDFKLIAAAWLPLLVHGQETDFGYPSRDEIKKASEQAEALANFLKASGGLVRTGRLTYGHRDAVEKLATELRAIQKTKYKKPKATDPAAEVEFGIELAVGLKQQFGSPSPKIVSAFLNVIEYDHDEARVRDIIQMAEARGDGN